MGLTPDWIIHAAAFKVFELPKPTPERPFIQGLLDPCTNSKLAPNIPAERLYDKADDGLAVSNPWAGHYVLLNPEYRSQVQWRFVNRAIDEVENGRVPGVVLVCRNGTDTGYYQRLSPYPRVLLRRASARFKVCVCVVCCVLCSSFALRFSNVPEGMGGESGAGGGAACLLSPSLPPPLLNTPKPPDAPHTHKKPHTKTLRTMTARRSALASSSFASRRAPPRRPCTRASSTPSRPLANPTSPTTEVRSVCCVFVACVLLMMTRGFLGWVCAKERARPFFADAHTQNTTIQNNNKQSSSRAPRSRACSTACARTRSASSATTGRRCACVVCCCVCCV